MLRKQTNKNKELKRQQELMFRRLWDKYPRICEVTGKTIPTFSTWNFHHILTKGAYPSFYLREENILICLPMVHRDIHDHPMKKEYEFVAELHAKLKRQYYDESKIKTYVKFKTN